MNAPPPPLRFALASVFGTAGIVLASGVEFLTRGALTSLDGIGLVGPLLVGVATLGILAILWLSILRLRGTRVSMAILLTPILIAVFTAALATRLDPAADAPDTLGLGVWIERARHLGLAFLGCSFAAVLAAVTAWCVAIDALARCAHRKPAAAGATAILWFGMAVLGIFAGLSLSDEAVGIPGSLGVPHLGAALAAVVAALGLGSGDDDVRGRALRDGLAVTGLGVVATYAAAYAAAIVDVAQLTAAIAAADGSRLTMIDQGLGVVEEELVVATCLTLAPLSAMLVPLFTCRDVFANAVQTRPAVSGAALLALLAIMGIPPVLQGMTRDELVATASEGLPELPEVTDVHLPAVATADDGNPPSPNARVVTVGTESIRDGDVVVGPRTMLSEGSRALRARLGVELSGTTLLFLDEDVSVAELYVLLDALTEETTARFGVIVDGAEHRAAFTGALAGMPPPPHVVPLMYSSSVPQGVEYVVGAGGVMRRLAGVDTLVGLPLEIDREPGWISASDDVRLVRVLTAISLPHTPDDVVVFARPNP